MDNALARHVALATHRSKQGLDDLIGLLQNHCSVSEIENFRSALAVVDQKFASLLEMVFADHPGLEQDITEKKQKFGKPI
ncbi:MAG TPA: hypothetical protein VHX19_09160 [Stellaceae bacterium]|jgi:hypothetical protein|nr:hypothetical protein [Stellaceae bacterium]